MNTLETLRAMDALFSSPKKWRQGYYAYDAIGRMVEPRDNHACGWCLMGAAFRVLGARKTADHVATQTNRALHKAGAIPSVPVWQDAPERTFADVKDLLARAIAAEESKA